MITIKEKDFESFFEAPFLIRGKKTHFASTFKSDLKKMLSTQNPIFKTENDYTYYTIFENNRPVGRISAHIHHAFNERYDTKKCYFGFFECIDNQTIANQLFDLVERFANRHGCDTIAGNFNLTAMQEMGVMIDGFENEPYILQSYGMPYYPTLMQNAGFEPTFPMATYEMDIDAVNPEEIITPQQRELIHNPDIEIVPITKSKYNEIRGSICDIFNKSFDQNPLFVPISQAEFDFQAKDLVYFMDSHISFMVKHKGQPIGLSIHIPDINPLLRATGSRFSLTTIYHFIKYKLQRKRALCIFSAILPEYQRQGVLGIILYKTIYAMRERGYKTFGITWISDSNKASLRKIAITKSKKLHELRIFEKKIK